MIRVILTASLIIAICLPAAASEFVYDGPKLEIDYNGPVLIDNSHFLYTNEDMRSFKIDEYLMEQKLTNLLPMLASISGWSSMHGIHPKILIGVLERFWNGAETDNTRAEIDQVYQIATGLATVFWDEYDSPLAATRAVLAVVNAYGLPTDLPSNLARSRTVAKSPSVVTLFGYFQPPWTIGDTWTGGGAHGDTGSGIRNALDYWGGGANWDDDTSSWWVAAMQDGTATVHAVCSISIVHADGWKTTYYHLENPQISSGAVTRNTVLANYANDLATATCLGGSSTGPHVHNAVYHNGVRIEIDEANIDFTAYSHHAGEGQYDFNCATSWYNHFTLGKICPAYDQLLNNAPVPADPSFFSDGFETGNTSAWSSTEP